MLRFRSAGAFVILLYAVAAAPCVAQTPAVEAPSKKNFRFYGQFGVGADMLHEGGWGLRTGVIGLNRAGWGAGLSARWYSYEARLLPPGYDPGGIDFFGTGIRKPRDHAGTLAAVAYRRLQSHSAPVRADFSAGPAIVYATEKVFAADPNSGFFGPTHSYINTGNLGAGALLQASLAVSFNESLGMEVGFFTLLNRRTSLLGMELSLDVGSVR